MAHWHHGPTGKAASEEAAGYEHLSDGEPYGHRRFQGAELAATSAADLARSTGSELHVVSAFPGSAYVHPYYEVRFPEAAERLRREAREERQEILDEQVERIRKAGKDVAQTHIRTGEAAKEIVALAEEIGVGLIAMGSHGLGGIRRALIGSVSAVVVPHAHCPVLVTRHMPKGSRDEE